MDVLGTSSSLPPLVKVITAQTGTLNLRGHAAGLKDRIRNVSATSVSALNIE